MQQYKNTFVDDSIKNLTLSNIQSCIRLNDLDFIGDGIHFGLFNMIGTFSFRHWSVEKTINFWMEFLNTIGVKVDYVTVHPDLISWKQYYSVDVKVDSECKWSDGNIGGYCTEFYVNGVEIGNIVNPLGDCIDVGFGLERLDFILNNTPLKSKEELLEEIIIKLIQEGYYPGPKQHGYILRKLLKSLYKTGGYMKHSFFENERDRQLKMSERYKKLLSKYPNQTKEWWYETHGIEIEQFH